MQSAIIFILIFVEAFGYPGNLVKTAFEKSIVNILNDTVDDYAFYTIQYTGE